MFYSFLLSFLFEAYLNLCLVSLINITKQPQDEIGDKFNFYFAILQGVLLVLFPIVLYVYFRKNKSKFEDEKFVEKF